LKAATAYRVQLIIKYVDLRATQKEDEKAANTAKGKKGGVANIGGSGLPPKEKKPKYKNIESP
jgi:hypothetical protein